MRIWHSSGYYTGTERQLRAWHDDQPEPSTSSNEVILGAANVRKVAVQIAKHYAEQKQLADGDHVVHIRDIESGKLFSVSVLVATETVTRIEVE